MIYSILKNCKLISVVAILCSWLCYFFFEIDYLQLCAFLLMFVDGLAEFFKENQNRISIQGCISLIVCIFMVGCFLSFFSIGPYKFICICALCTLVVVSLLSLIRSFISSNFSDIDVSLYVNLIIVVFVSSPQFVRYRYFSKTQIDRPTGKYEYELYDGEYVEKLCFDEKNNCYVSHVSNGDTLVIIRWAQWSPDYHFVESSDTIILNKH